MPVAIDFVRCLAVRDSVRPGQLGKCPILMARMTVEGTGINRTVCRKAERHPLVDLDRMVLQERFYRMLVVGAGGSGFGPRGILQRLLVRLHWLVMIMVLFLIILKLYLEKIAVR